MSRTSGWMNEKDAKGNSLLMLAAQAGDLSVCETLIAAGADFDMLNSAGATALMLAAIENNDEVCGVLIAAGANIDVQDLEGNTSLMLALRGKNPKAIAALMKEGASLDIKNSAGKSAKDLAADTGLTAILEGHAVLGTTEVGKMQKVTAALAAASSASSVSSARPTFAAEGAPKGSTEGPDSDVDVEEGDPKPGSKRSG
jgi:uncharacterized protein